jgi:hypothetical protein
MIRGCDTSKLVRAAPGRRIVYEVESKERPDLSKTDLGEASRQMICARLMLLKLTIKGLWKYLVMMLW